MPSSTKGESHARMISVELLWGSWNRQIAARIWVQGQPANQTKNQSAEPATEGVEMSGLPFEVLVYGTLPLSSWPRASRGELAGHHHGQQEAHAVPDPHRGRALSHRSGGSPQFPLTCQTLPCYHWDATGG